MTLLNRGNALEMYWPQWGETRTPGSNSIAVIAPVFASAVFARRSRIIGANASKTLKSFASLFLQSSAISVKTHPKQNVRAARATFSVEGEIANNISIHCVAPHKKWSEFHFSMQNKRSAQTSTKFANSLASAKTETARETRRAMQTIFYRRCYSSRMSMGSKIHGKHWQHMEWTLWKQKWFIRWMNWIRFSWFVISRYLISIPTDNWYSCTENVVKSRFYVKCSSHFMAWGHFVYFQRFSCVLDPTVILETRVWLSAIRHAICAAL